MRLWAWLRKNALLLAPFLLFSQLLQAKDLSTHGKTYQIKERDALEMMADRLKALEMNGNLQKYQLKITDNIKKSIDRPKSVASLAKTRTQRTFSFDPNISITRDIKDHEGKIIQKGGSNLNPLLYVSLGSPWLLLMLTMTNKCNGRYCLKKNTKS